MSDFDELPGDTAGWVEISPQLMQSSRISPPRSGHPGMEKQGADLSLLCAALEEQLKMSAPPATFQSIDSKDANAVDLCVSQFGEWPSRPNVSGPRSLLLSSSRNSPGQRSANISPPNSPEGAIRDDPDEGDMPWRLRHSSFFRCRTIGWIIDNFPALLRHFASFLLGSATMFLILKKRVKLPPPSGHLPPF